MAAVPGSADSNQNIEISELGQLEVDLILAVLEEFETKLSLLRTRMPRVSARFDLRFLRERGAEPYLQPYKPMSRRASKLWEWKLAWELDLLDRVVATTKQEMRTQGTACLLESFIKHQQDLQFELQQYEEIAKEGSCRTPSLGKQNNTSKEQLNLQVSSLKNKYLRLQIRIGIVKQYMENYERNIIQQNKIKIELIERDLNNKIDKLLKGKGDEELAHNLIMKYFSESIEMLNCKVKYWQKEWKNDTALRDSEYKKLEADMKDQSQKTHDLINDYERREKELESYLQEREVREQVRKEEEEIRRCVVKIQAWWRGCMVRWGLGSYSPDSLARKRRKRPKKK